MPYFRYDDLDWQARSTRLVRLLKESTINSTFGKNQIICELTLKHLDCTDDDENQKYTAVSYCWGANQNILLLTTNVNAYTECIPVESLPRTIADAVIITRKMKLRYLWVDALCILQNSEEDLAHELSYMGELYANA